MKYLIALLLSSFTVAFCKAQNADMKVYSDLLMQIEQVEKTEHLEHTYKLPVYYMSSIRLLKPPFLKKVDVKYWYVYTNTYKDWKQFADNATADQLQDEKLPGPVGAHELTKQLYKHDENYKPFSFLTLSPIVYSLDKTMALCTVYDWFSADDVSYTEYVLELRGGNWVLIRSLLTAYSSIRITTQS